MLEAVKVALDPTPSQIRAFNSHAGASRFAYNAALHQVKVLLEARSSDATVDVPWSYYSLRRWWNSAKDALAPWWAENSKEAYNSGLEALAAGLKNFSSSRKGKRKGQRVNFPRFKTRQRARKSFQYTTGSFGVADPYGVKLPRIGRVHTHERIDDRIAGATVKRVTVSESGGRWFASFTVERPDEHQANRPPAGSVVGVDLGVSALATLSTGEVIENPRHLKKAQRKLRRLGKAYSRTQRGSKGRSRAADKLSRAHARVRNLRADTIHKMTTNLSSRFETVVLEDLNVAGMARNRRLAQALGDASFGEVRRQIEYKQTRRGNEVVLADRWYPSTKTCSNCGAVKAKLPLHVRTFVCDECQLTIDRDLNAAINLKQLVAGSGPETQNGDGEPVRPMFASARICEVTTRQEPKAPSDLDRQLVTVASHTDDYC